jgi:hypothetical protein
MRQSMSTYRDADKFGTSYESKKCLKKAKQLALLLSVSYLIGEVACRHDVYHFVDDRLVAKLARQRNCQLQAVLSRMRVDTGGNGQRKSNNSQIGEKAGDSRARPVPDGSMQRGY